MLRSRLAKNSFTLVNVIVQRCFSALGSVAASVNECECMVNGRPTHCQSISRVVWPLSFTLQGMRYVSSSHEASHHGTASILPPLCQVLPAPLCFSVLLCLLSPLASICGWCFLFSSSSHVYSPVCLSAQRSSLTPAASFRLTLFLRIRDSAEPRSFSL